ncbi:MAG: hypothetical protein IKV01_01285, partial [Clostridia bacterium]|nr:hypothetical protein [Clostridia bacterium]
MKLSQDAKVEVNGEEIPAYFAGVCDADASKYQKGYWYSQCTNEGCGRLTVEEVEPVHTPRAGTDKTYA